MLGPVKPRRLDGPIAVSLEDLVPADNFYRHLEAKLDLGFVREKLRPQQVTGDTTYGTTENIVAVEDAGIRAFFPRPDFDSRTPFFGKGTFTYDSGADAYRCPQGQVLPRRKTNYTEAEVLYQADAASCNACSLKTQCTPGRPRPHAPPLLLRGLPRQSAWLPRH